MLRLFITFTHIFLCHVVSLTCNHEGHPYVPKAPLHSSPDDQSYEKALTDYCGFGEKC